MGFFVESGKLLIFGFLLIGVLGTWQLGFSNGTFKIIQELVEQSNSRLPNSDIPMQNAKTGIKAVDGLIGTVLAFFYPIFSGHMPKLTLQGLHFYGQLVATWMLMLVEGSRLANAWSAISFVTAWGLLIENVAMALALPTWCLLHLLTSLTLAPAQSDNTRQRSLLVHPVELSMMPWAVLIGCGVPSVLAFVCSAEVVEPFYQSQQFWILARMVHPLLTAIAQISLSFASRSNRQFGSVADRNYAVISSMRNIYTVATTVAVASHACTLGLSISSVLAPSIFDHTLSNNLAPDSVFVPTSLWGVTAKVQTIAEGASIFLQWDELVSCLSILTWAFVINRHSLSGEADCSNFSQAIFKALAWSAVGGPATAAIKLVEERDEWVLGYLGADEPEPEPEPEAVPQSQIITSIENPRAQPVQVANVAPVLPNTAPSRPANMQPAPRQRAARQVTDRQGEDRLVTKDEDEVKQEDYY